MKKIIWVLLVISGMFSSCSSGDNENVTQVQPPVLLKKIEVTADNGYTITEFSRKTTFEYNGTKIVKSYAPGSRDESYFNGYYYFYTGNLITKIEGHFEHYHVSDEFFEYNSQQQLVKYTYTALTSFNTEPMPSYGEVTTYVHNADGTISFERSGWDNTHPDHIPLTLIVTGKIYEDRIENIEIGSDPIYPNMYYGMKFKFDGKSNPLKNITGFDKIGFVLLHSDLNLHRHDYYHLTNYTQNIVSSTFSNSDINNPSTYQLGFPHSEFTYTNDGYPATEHNFQWAHSFTVAFTYNR